MIKELEFLKINLGDCKKGGISNCTHKSSYEIINKPLFYVFDNREDAHNPVIILDEKGKSQLTIRNEAASDICILKTDNCLFDGKDPNRCDCILFNSQKVFFVEISESRKRAAKREHARLQLGTTIKKFREIGIDLSNYDTTAVICFKSSQDRVTAARDNTNRDLFKSQYKVTLEEYNWISF